MGLAYRPGGSAVLGPILATVSASHAHAAAPPPLPFPYGPGVAIPSPEPYTEWIFNQARILEAEFPSIPRRAPQTEIHE